LSEGKTYFWPMAWCQEGQQKRHFFLRITSRKKAEILQEVPGLDCKRLEQSYFPDKATLTVWDTWKIDYLKKKR